ncbi:hypothetical protein FOFC_17979 [Fusarium oxysporum]|nr:hypothetical protein FOFC_17979 [Fusarium oxysporum]
MHAGYCGTITDHWGKGYQSTCDFKLEYDKSNPCKGNACCFKYGYCGLGPDCDVRSTSAVRSMGNTTKDFCGKKTVNRLSCSAKGSPIRRVVGYYEGWATTRSCDRFSPSDIPDGVYTYINFAFASINPKTFKIAPASSEDPALYPTYGFDGVDIDWEYLAADDREGREEDFANLPKLLNNIKSALKQNGDRNGLSIAIPASYWYLQHFDLAQISKHVDHFNVMTYDFHGAWDTPKSWLGNHLNSHTNLTEIKDAFDLLWRNKIDPNQVNMGLAFYARTFTASSSSCMSPGCLFDAGGPAEPCTDAVGVMSNPEIMHKLGGKAGQGDLDKTAAVKTLTFGPLGGGVFKETTESEANIDVPIDPCRWSDCGKACPSEWSAVQRMDPWRRNSQERMQDSTGCGGDSLRTFCCPRGEQPFCQWIALNKGNCNPGCPDANMVEVRLYKKACNNGKAQVACCRGSTPALDVYRQYKCWDGSGAQDCRDSKGEKGMRPLCGVESDLSKAHFINCQWIDNFDLGLTSIADREQCSGNCPLGKIKVALEENEDMCKHGTMAFYCDAESTITRKDIDKSDVRDALKAWVKHPMCPSVTDNKGLLSRSTGAGAVSNILEHAPDSPDTREDRKIWDEAVSTRWQHISAANLAKEYINGDNGEALAKANNDDDKFFVNNNGGNCGSSKDQLATCSMWKDAFLNGFPAWTKAGNTNTPKVVLYSKLGLVTDPSDMVNCETVLNGYKALVIGVWQYLNNDKVLEKLANVHIAVADFLDEFEKLYRIQYPKTGPIGLSDIHWRSFISRHFDNMVAFTQEWTKLRLQELQKN